MSTNYVPSDDFLKYLADTARELAEMGRRAERAMEKRHAAVVASREDSRRAREALLEAASGLHVMASSLNDFNKTAYQATEQATASLVEFFEEYKKDMRRLAELSDMMAAYLSAPPDDGLESGDEPPDPPPGDEPSDLLAEDDPTE
ncbi:MAG: hypothetical protein OXD37_07745 [Acidimicrobiaceae bacterium]|nr:hypothetical protein [Acidimicrobiaceae bacterium]